MQLGCWYTKDNPGNEHLPSDIHSARLSTIRDSLQPHNSHKSECINPRFLLSFGFYGLIQFLFIKTLAYVQQNRITELERTSKIIWSSGSQIPLCIRTFCRAFEKYKIWGAGPDLQARFFGDGTQESIYLKVPRPGPTFRKHASINFKVRKSFNFKVRKEVSEKLSDFPMMTHRVHGGARCPDS